MTNLESILHELREERDRLDKAIAALSSLDDRGAATGGRFSPAARKRMSLAQKARRAREQGEAPGGKLKPRRKMSAAGRARIAAAAKARWARWRAGKKK